MSGSRFKVGDRVRMWTSSFTGKEGTVSYVADAGTSVNVRPDGFGGRELAFGFRELTLVGSKFDFNVGDKLTTSVWSYMPERFVTVEWIGPSQFAGETHDGKKVVHDFASANSNWQKWVKTYHFPFKVGDQVRLSNGSWDKGLLVTEISPPDEHWWRTEGLRMHKEPSLYAWELVPEPVHPFKVGDKVRNSNTMYEWPAVVAKAWFDDVGIPMVDCAIGSGHTWTCTPASIWEHYVGPTPAPAPPVVKRWLVTTEERLARKGQAYVSKVVGEIYQAGADFEGVTTNVITSVQPLTNLNDWIVGGDGK